MKLIIRFLSVVYVLFLAGCMLAPAAPGSNAQSPVPTPGALPQAATPIITPLPTTFAGGQNEDGTFYRGSPDAPVTLIEYSDYL